MHELEAIKAYLDGLIEMSTPKCPIWNKEQILQSKQPSWNYIDGVMMKAILAMNSITGEQHYFDFVDDYISHFVQEDGTVLTYTLEDYNLDDINEGVVLFPLYKATGKEKYKKAIEQLYHHLQEQPRTKTGNFWHKAIYPNQVWLDGLYMAQPFYMAYETQYNGLKHYKDIFQQFLNVESTMKDPQTGLYYHAYDSEKTMFWCDPNTGLSKCFWGRAMGWYVMALIDVVEAMDEQMFYEYRYLIQLFRESIDALIQVQSETGMWYQVLDQGDRAGNYLETSASAIIAYAILKGVRLEVLPERYEVYGMKAFEDICKRYLVKGKDGALTLGGICLVAGLGGKQMRDGSYDYYMQEPVVENEAKGVAPFLMAFTELYRKQLKVQREA